MQETKQTKSGKKMTKWQQMEVLSVCFLITINNEFGKRGAYAYSASVGGLLLGGGLNFPKWLKLQMMLRKIARQKRQAQ